MPPRPQIQHLSAVDRALGLVVTRNDDRPVLIGLGGNRAQRLRQFARVAATAMHQHDDMWPQLEPTHDRLAQHRFRRRQTASEAPGAGTLCRTGHVDRERELLLVTRLGVDVNRDAVGSLRQRSMRERECETSQARIRHVRKGALQVLAADPVISRPGGIAVEFHRHRVHAVPRERPAFDGQVSLDRSLDHAVHDVGLIEMMEQLDVCSRRLRADAFRLAWNDGDLELAGIALRADHPKDENVLGLDPLRVYAPGELEAGLPGTRKRRELIADIGSIEPTLGLSNDLAFKDDLDPLDRRR